MTRRARGTDNEAESFRKVREQLGTATIASVCAFARATIRTSAKADRSIFSHVADADLRSAMSRTLYGTRWVYKLQLALTLEGEERAAHLRLQVLDYASLCEALLWDIIQYGGMTRRLKGRTLLKVGKKSVDWSANGLRAHFTTFSWLIDVARNASIVDKALAEWLHMLREARNTVHLTRLAEGDVEYVMDVAKMALAVMHATATSTRDWKRLHR
jgi:hypothetical protein